jgi:hypothetical protein
MDDSCHDLRKRRLRYERDNCRRNRRGIVLRLLAKMRRRRGAPAQWGGGPDFGGGDLAGVREPRRPKPSAGSAAMALEVPRSA